MRTLFTSVLLAVVGACSAEVGPIDSASSALRTDNRIAANRIAANRIAANRIAANRIAANRISANHLALDPVAGGLLASEGGREVLSFMISCALRSDQQVSAVHEGKTYDFAGALGLAPSWVKRPLSERDQRWVSACLLSRVNARELSVQISLRGPHRALSTSAGEMAAFSLEEGAFWGNLFGPDDEPLDANACRGLDQASGERGDLADRDCTEPDPDNPGYTLCGFKFAGDCGDFVPDPACRKFNPDGMYYGGCSTSGRRRDSQREVITTFVQP